MGDKEKGGRGRKGEQTLKECIEHSTQLAIYLFVSARSICKANYVLDFHFSTHLAGDTCRHLVPGIPCREQIRTQLCHPGVSLSLCAII